MKLKNTWQHFFVLRSKYISKYPQLGISSASNYVELNIVGFTNVFKWINRIKFELEFSLLFINLDLCFEFTALGRQTRTYGIIIRLKYSILRMVETNDQSNDFASVLYFLKVHVANVYMEIKSRHEKLQANSRTLFQMISSKTIE